MRFFSFTLVVCSMLAGCGSGDGPTAHSSADVTSQTDLPGAKFDSATDTGAVENENCTITMCLTGALNQGSGSNRFFKGLCEDPRVDGLLYDCGPWGCESTFDSFLQFPLLAVYPSLRDALDQNGDGQVDDADPVCEVNLVGFSWGGVNAVSVAQHLEKDEHIPASHKEIARMVLLDAFQPLSRERMTVPENVANVLSVRHSEAPEDDCSQGVIWGPYVGFAPICETQARCDDFDYSAYPQEIFAAQTGLRRYGDEIGHCQVPNFAHQTVIDFLSTP